MFQKLKLHLIMINVVLLTIVLVMIFSGIYFIMEHVMNQQSLMIMKGVATEEQVIPPIGVQKTKKPLSNSFFVKINTKGEIIGYSSELLVSKQETEELKKIVLKKEKQSGNIVSNNLNLKFLKLSKSYGFIIVFMENSIEKTVYKSLIIASLSIGFISLALVFLISLFLANKAIIPIKNSWEKQNVFIADASHELRTPLAVLNSSLEIVMENGSETVQSQFKWLNNVQWEISRMTKLVNDLLFLAQADVEEMPISPLNISDIIYKTYEIFKPLADKKGLNLMFDSTQDVVVPGNLGRIQQLLNIMLDNAIKHTPSGGNIELKLQLGESTYELIIKDDGEGISKDERDKIFQRFYRVDKSRSKSQGGTGLGLSIAECIVKEHRGVIKVSSTLGKGTEFHVILPAEFNS